MMGRPTMFIMGRGITDSDFLRPPMGISTLSGVIPMGERLARCEGGAPGLMRGASSPMDDVKRPWPHTIPR